MDWIDPQNGSLPYWDPKINSQEDFEKYGKKGERYLGQEGVLGIDPLTGRAIYGNSDGTTSLLYFGIEEITISAPYPSNHARTMANPIVQDIHRVQRAYPIGMWIMSFATAAQASKNILQSAIQLMVSLEKQKFKSLGVAAKGFSKNGVNRLNNLIKTGKSPKSIERADKGRIFGEKDHVHFSDGSALNADGTWKHGGRSLSNSETKFLKENGWTLPL